MKKVLLGFILLAIFASGTFAASLTNTTVNGTLNVTGATSLNTLLRYNKVTVPTAFTGVAIQAAINQISAEGGGILFLPAGTYTLATTIIINTPNITLIGAGASTIISDSNGTTPVISVTTGATAGVEICDISYTSGSVVSGISISTGANHVRVTRCIFDGYYNYAITTTGNYTYIDGNTFGGKNAILATNTEGVQIIGNRIINSVGYSSAYTINMAACTNEVISNNYIYCNDTGSPANMISCDTACLGGVIVDNNISLIASGYSGGILGIANGGSNFVIMNNRVIATESASGGATPINSTGNYCIVAGNNCRGSKNALSASGTGTITTAGNINN